MELFKSWLETPMSIWYHSGIELLFSNRYIFQKVALTYIVSSIQHPWPTSWKKNRCSENTLRALNLPPLLLTGQSEYFSYLRLSRREKKEANMSQKKKDFKCYTQKRSVNSSQKEVNGLGLQSAGIWTHEQPAKRNGTGGPGLPVTRWTQTILFQGVNQPLYDDTLAWKEFGCFLVKAILF